MFAWIKTSHLKGRTQYSHLLGLITGPQLMPESVDAQVPCTTWCNICLSPRHPPIHVKYL